MPFKFRWPFSWPRRRPPAPNTPGLASRQPLAARVEPAAGAAPVQRAQAEPPSPAPIAQAPEGPDLGLELLGRLSASATPPTLGPLGGLPAMAQTLLTVERFLRKLPTPPALPLLSGLTEAAGFAATLSSLAGFTAPGTAERPPAFPAQLEPPSEPTDVLAPPGGMPGQLAGLSGAAPLFSPSREPPPPQIVSAPAAPTTTPPGGPVQRETARPGAEAVSAWPFVAAQTLSADIARSLTAPAGRLLAAWTQPAAPITQVLPPEQTLTGNVLAVSTGAPIQREAVRAVEEEWSAPAEFVQPAEQTGERVSPELRDAIESQRGQGRPLEPETRQRFEQAYGQPLDDVRVHTGATPHSTAQSLNAIAFATGQDLFFTQNTYSPDNPQGLSLIGHELAHVIQQQYGVAGDADALRPPDDRYERQADQLAAQALETPVFQAAPAAEPLIGHASVQRNQDDELALPGSPLTLPAASTWTPREQLNTAAGPGAQAQPLASPISPWAKLPEDEPIQRFNAANAAGPASPAPAATSSQLPSLVRTPERLGGLTSELPTPGGILSKWVSLAQNLPGLGDVSQAGQSLPVFRSILRGLPGLGSVPDLTRNLPDLGQSNLPDIGSLTHQLPGASNLAQGLPGMGDNSPALPDLGGVAQSLSGAGLPPMPGAMGAALPSLGGMTPPEMPLAQGLGEAGAGQAAQGAMGAGQQALGTINSMAPAGAEGPSTPPLPSLDKLTEHIWKEVQRKLKVERERSRGLA